MKRNFYFIAGLPRSGSSLLSALLNQNPKFYSGPSSPIFYMISDMEKIFSNNQLLMAYPKMQQIGNYISDVFKYYYSDVNNSVIFDKNRAWPAKLDMLSGIFGEEPKVLCPVRNIDEILASFLHMHKRNPYQVNGNLNFIDKSLVQLNLPLNDLARCDYLMSRQGMLGDSLECIKYALLSGRQKQLHFIEYDDLMNDPENTIKKIYEFLDETYYKHNYQEIKQPYKELDVETYGFADMHSVRQVLQKSNINPEEILPPEVYKDTKNLEFWRNIDNLDVNNTSNIQQ